MKLHEILLPSWRFFENTGVFAKAYYRKVPATDWLPLFPPLTRAWWQIFVNPEGNARHTCVNHLYRILGELGSSTPEAIEASDSYLVIKRCVEAQVRQPGAHFQFKICSADPAGEEDLFLSAIHTLWAEER